VIPRIVLRYIDVYVVRCSRWHISYFHVDMSDTEATVPQWRQGLYQVTVAKR